jgi:hypothetical protein
MWDARYWERLLKDAERELDAAITLADLNEAAKRYRRIKAELKRLEEAPG